MNIFMRKKYLKICALICAAVLAAQMFAGCAASRGGSSGASSSQSSSATRVVKDSAGRSVTIPTTVNRVYCAVPTAEAMVYSLAPDKMVGWVNTPSDEQKEYLSDKAKSLPVLGGWMGEKSTANLEEIIKQKPDLIVFMTTTSINGNYTDLANSIQQQTSCPVVVLDSALSATPDMYLKLGDWLGVEARAKKLANYCKEKLSTIKKEVASIPDDKLVSVYYAEAATGLATDPTGSDHTEVLDFVRGKNVADVEKKSGQGMTAVSMEQVLSWNPSVVLVSPTSGTDTYKKVTTDSNWAKIKAVADKRVYMVPSLPFNFFDRPPSVSRILGIQWLANLLYPDTVKLDIKAQAKEFYATFYNVKLTDEQLNNIFAQAL